MSASTEKVSGGQREQALPASGIITLCHQMIEGAFKFILANDPAAFSTLTHFQGFTLKIRCTSPPVTGFVIVECDQVIALSHTENKVDAVLAGTLSDLLYLCVYLVQHPATFVLSNDKMLSNEAKVVYPRGIQVEGDKKKLSALLRLIQRSEPDWEYRLSEKTHPLFAHMMGKGVRMLAGTFQRQVKRNVLMLKEYAKEESTLLSASGQYQSLQSETLCLKQRMVALEARIDDLLMKKTLDK